MSITRRSRAASSLSAAGRSGPLPSPPERSAAKRSGDKGGGSARRRSRARIRGGHQSVQYPLWSQSLNRYSYGFNNPMSGSDPTGYSWLSDVLSNDDTPSWAIGGAIIAVTAIAVASQYDGGASAQAATSSGVGVSVANVGGGGIGIAQATATLNGFGATGSSAAPKGAFGAGSQGGLSGGFGQTNEPATCADVGGNCSRRRFGSSPMDQIVLDFLNTQSHAPEAPGTIGDTLTAIAAPEHVAAIIQTAEGGFRLGPVQVSTVDWDAVLFRTPTLATGERWVGVIHSHPGAPTDILAQSRAPDLVTARRFAGQQPTFRSSYVVGPSGRGPYLGVIVFQPNPNPGALITLGVAP